MAVASGSVERAAAQAEALGVPRAVGSYEELLADPAWRSLRLAAQRAARGVVRGALEAGKHVLCEKPLARSEEAASGRSTPRGRPGGC